jgi:drug/metabolite transporter (DMT)-like permease
MRLPCADIWSLDAVGILYVLAAVLLWSVIPLLVKQIVPPFDPRWVAMLRLVLGTGFLAVAERLIAVRSPAPVPPRWRKRELALLIAAGATIGGDYLLYTAGIARTTASAGNLIVQIEIIALSLWGLIVLKENVSAVKLSGMALCFAGVFLVGWNGQSLHALARSEYFAGNLLVLGGGLCWSVYALTQKMLLDTRGAGETVVPIMAIGAVMAAAVAVFSPSAVRAPTALQWGYLVGLGCFCTGLSYLLMVRGLQRLEASHLALLATLNPIFTMIEAHFLLGENLTGFLIAGAVLVVSGVVLMAGLARESASLRASSLGRDHR